MDAKLDVIVEAVTRSPSEEVTREESMKTILDSLFHIEDDTSIDRDPLAPRRQPYWWEDKRWTVKANFIDYDEEPTPPVKIEKERTAYGAQPTRPPAASADSGKSATPLRNCSCARGEKSVFNCWSCDAV